MHIQAQLQDPIDAVDRTGFACYYYWILIRLFHRADNMQRVLFIVGSSHLHCSSYKLNPYVNSIGTRLGLGRLAHLLVLLFFRLRARLEHHWF